MSSEFGQYIKHLRLRREMSQSELGRRADLHTSFLSRIESGEREPSRATVDAIADVLGIDHETARLVAFGYSEDSPVINRLRAALSALPASQEAIVLRQVTALVETAEYMAACEGVSNGD